MARFALNAYRGDAMLLAGDKVLRSKEGTTQGCPLAGLLYAVGIAGLHKQAKPLTVRGQLEAQAARRAEPQQQATAPTSVGSSAETQLSQAAPQAPPTDDVNRPNAAEGPSIYSNAVVDYNYADDSAAVGFLDSLASWYDVIATKGPDYGYHVNSDKLVVIVPEERHLEAVRDHLRTAYGGAFGKAEIVSGAVYLGGYVGDEEGRKTKTAEKVGTWTKKLKKLAEAAASVPQAHYRCLTMAAQHWPDYYQRAVPTTADEFAPFEEAVRQHSIPAITGRKQPVSDAERLMFSLPARKGGLGITNATVAASTHHSTADAATSYLVGALNGEHDWHVAEHLTTFNKARADRKEAAEEAAKATIASLLADGEPTSLPPNTQRAFKRAAEHNTSAWLTAAPAVSHGLALTAHEFRDGLALRYGWEPVETEASCAG
jgi:hypothetical protein